MKKSIIISTNRTIERYQQTHETMFLSLLFRLVENNDGELRSVINEIEKK